LTEANQFSKRQIEVIELLLQGKGNKHIAIWLMGDSSFRVAVNGLCNDLGINSF